MKHFREKYISIEKIKFAILLMILLGVSTLFGKISKSLFFHTQNTNVVPQILTDSTEIALIFIGSSTCPSANEDEIGELLMELNSSVREIAINNNINSTFLGFSIELNVQEGISYLTSMADFDEISVGNFIRNAAISKYIWQEFGGKKSKATPQILLVKREYNRELINGIHHYTQRISREKLIGRFVGVDEIKSIIAYKNELESILMI